MIDITYSKAVAVVKLDNGAINPLNLEVIHELSATLARLRAMPEIHALVVSSASEKFFSIGFDIPSLFDLPRDSFSEFFQAFNQVCMDLYTLPKPTIAAITGHAIAGGCILALCCDYRLIGTGRKLIGLNEIKLGVPVPYVADCILQSIVGTREARDVVESGEFFEAEASFKKGLVDEVLPQDQVMARAMEKAEQLSLLSPEAYSTIKENRIEQVKTRIQASWEEKQQDFVEMWYSEAARKQLREAMKRY